MTQGDSIRKRTENEGGRKVGNESNREAKRTRGEGQAASIGDSGRGSGGPEQGKVGQDSREE